MNGLYWTAALLAVAAALVFLVDHVERRPDGRLASWLVRR